MGKRYYCDYCDRSFQDTLHNRKKHLNGVQHQRAKKAWLDNFRDTAAILQDERAKPPCRKFLQTGACVFGHNCLYSHLSEMDIKALEQQIEEEKWQKMMPGDKHSEPSVEEWLSRREKKKAAMTSGSVLKMEEEEAAENSDVPLFLRSIPDLPPSLLPPHPGGWRASVHSDWG
ncbi:zinc finger matrin-type protein 5 [Astyanax mexicanus]|uniref:Zinc finger matrin-type protein 5 n=1 Tax=Astyanax mexicanus TaxID=7994 RepID=W5KHV8_ASTMX|nr:zinc finger matrin-type protein 5 [Astyanax mexicanus]